MHGKIRKIMLISLFVSFEIILTRFLSVESPIVRISFEFIPIALSAILFGPAAAGGAAAAADVLGMLIFPKGAFFPGFTISAFISGFLYGAILYKKQITLWRVFIAVLSVNVACSLTLNTIWLVIFFHNGAYATLIARLMKCAVFLPVQTLMIYFIWRYVGSFIKGTFNNTLGSNT